MYYVECPVGESNPDQKVSEKYAEKLNSHWTKILLLFRTVLKF